MEAAAPSARSPRVPGSGVEVPGPLPGLVTGAGHQDGITEQVAPRECAGGVPTAIRTHAEIPNIAFRMASPHVLRLAITLAKVMPYVLSARQA